MIDHVNQGDMPKLKLHVAKPNKQIIGYLHEVMKPSQTLKHGELNELSFSVPYLINSDNGTIRNPNIDLIKDKYLIKASFNNQIEWYVIEKKFDNSSDGKEILTVQAFSLGYQLKGFKIRDWQGINVLGEVRKQSLNAKQVLDDILAVTPWEMGYINSEFITNTRDFDFSNTSVLDVVFQVANAFNGVLVWDTENKTISLYKYADYGVNKGFKVSYNTYLKSINKESDSNNLITRLRVYGKDNLSISRLNPTGLDYLEDFSYFLNKDYMSDSLSQALIEYGELVDSKKPQTNGLLQQMETYVLNRVAKEKEIETLNTQLTDVQKLIDLKQSKQIDISVEQQNETDIKNQISIKQIELTGILNQITDLENQLKVIRDGLDMESLFSDDLINELKNFIHEETWEDQNCSNEKDLLDAARILFEEYRKPKILVNINLVNFFKLFEGYQDWGKVAVGDKFTIYYPNFDLDAESQIVEMNIDHDSTDISLTVANTRNYNDDSKSINKLIADSINAGKKLEINKGKWDSVQKVNDTVDQLLNNRWQSALREITAGANETVQINERGITITDDDDPNKFIRMTNSVIGLTRDGGQNFKTAITPDGVSAEELIGKIIITENLGIENDSGKYSFDKDGFVIVSNDEKLRVKLNVNEGLKFQIKGANNLFEDSFYYDSVNSRLTIKGEINAEELKINGESVLTDGKINATYIANLVVGETVQMGSGATISWGQVTGQPFIPSSAADVGALASDSPQMTYIDQSGVYTGTVVANQIYGGEITGVTINVTTDLTVGNNIYIGDMNSSEYKSLIFNLDAWMNTTPTGGLRINTSDKLEIPSVTEFTSYVNFTNTSYVDFSGAQVSGIYAKFK